MLERAQVQHYALVDNTGSPLQVPLRAADDYPYFKLAESSAARTYYEEFGYVVLRGLIPAALLDRANEQFDREVLPSPRHIYRQATANPERHVLTPQGHMLNSLLNLQSLDPRHYAGFRGAAEQVFTDGTLQAALTALLGEPGKLVQSMYFHGNPSTWPHQDTYYLDSEHIGSMTAAWIAAEDIAPGSGRFFVYPGSHRIDMRRNGGNFDIAFNHERYKQLVVDIIRSQRLECRAPALEKGDVLFWNGKTIHGSLPTSQPERSRRSLTAHYIPRSHRFLQHQSRIKPLAFDEVNGMSVARPKDQARASARAVLFLETRFPTAFRTAKKLALKVLAGR